MRFEAIHIRAKPEEIEATRVKAIRFLCKVAPKDYRAFYNRDGILQLQQELALSRYIIGWANLSCSLPRKVIRP